MIIAVRYFASVISIKPYVVSAGVQTAFPPRTEVADAFAEDSTVS